MIINPLCQLLGIYEYGDSINTERSWEGINSFFEHKTQEIRQLSEQDTTHSSTLDKVVSKCSEKVLENLERQVGKVAFFRGETESELASKMEYAPLTNSGCESRMAELDVRVKYSGGSAPLTTISDKQVVATNKYLLSKDFETEEKTREQFDWAKNSDEAKRANELQTEFLEQVKEVKKVAVRAKESIKTRKVTRTLKVLDSVKKHGGPITAESLNLLDTLTESQICTEVTYLKLTIAPDLKLRKRVKNTQTNKYQMIKLPVEQLKMSIKSVISPAVDVTQDLDCLLQSVFV